MSLVMKSRVTKSRVTKFRVPSRIARILVVTGLAALGLQPSSAFAQATTACGPEVKEAVARRLAGVESAPDLQKAAVYDELYKQYQPCMQDSTSVSVTFFEAARECGAAV